MPSGNSLTRNDDGVFDHHNIIDNRYEHRYSRDGDPGSSNRWGTGNAYASHGSGDKDDPRKRYNNTIITKVSNENLTTAIDPTPGSHPGLRFVNNIVYAETWEKVLRRGHGTGTSGTPDGNCYFRVANTGTERNFFTNYGDGTTDYSNLAGLKTDQPTWEQSSVEINPDFGTGTSGINGDFSRSAPADLPAIRTQYRPTQSSVLNGGIDITAEPWPDADNTGYIGAVP